MLEKIYLPFLLILSTFGLYAQIEISGTVTDASTGESLIGVNIVVVDAQTGTTTDIDGTYTLKVKRNAKALQFSYTGYSTKTVEIKDEKVINVSLASGELLDEVVVVGYGSQSKAKLTSAVSTIEAKELTKMPVGYC